MLQLRHKRPLGTRLGGFGRQNQIFQGRGAQGSVCGHSGGRGAKKQSNGNKDKRSQPPKKYELRACKLGNVIEYWCGICCCWTNHPTDKHNNLAALSTTPLSKDDANHSVALGASARPRDKEEAINVTDQKSSSSDVSFVGILPHFW